MVISKDKVPLVSSMPERLSDVRNVAIPKESILIMFVCQLSLVF
jgi:hypothetical protein